MEDVSATSGGNDGEVLAYCFRCKMRKTMHALTETRMRNGKLAYTGTCITCGTRMFKIAPIEPHREASSVLPPH